MANQSVFEKKYVEKDKMSDVEGLLEHFNLPTGVIVFIRNNVRTIQVCVAGLVVAAVVYSFYGSYTENRMKESSAALGLAMEQKDAQQIQSLENVRDSFSGTSAATWSGVALGHAYMNDKDFVKAYDAYSASISGVNASNTLYPLLLVGQAEALEGQGKYAEAFASYDSLREVNGFSELAFLGMARSWEARGDNEKAILVYNDFLFSIGDQPSPSKSYVEAKIVRLQSQN